MRLLLAAVLCAVLLGGCPKAPPPPAERAPLTMEEQAHQDCYVGSFAASAKGQEIMLVELRRQTALLQEQTALLREIERNTGRTP